MKTIDVKKIFKIMSNVQKKEMLKMLQNVVFDSVENYSALAEDSRGSIECPECGSTHIKKNGHYGDKQKYVCRACNKGFGVLTGTSVHGIHKKDLWNRFIELTLESKSIREICKEISISRQTCLDWRHKLLTAINDVFTKDFHGIVEMDDMLMRINQKGRRTNFIEESRRSISYINKYGNRVSKKIKGSRKRGISRDQVSVLLTVDRYGTIGTSMLKRGKMNSNSLDRVFSNGLLERLNGANTIVTDEAKAYVSVLNQYGFDHEHINAGEKQWSKGIYHLNTLNNTDGRFKQWIKYHFSSVSTKYLNNYLGYFKMLFFVLKDSGEKMEEFLRFSLTDVTTQVRFKNIENQYQEFLRF